jgi:hypothetical protein
VWLSFCAVSCRNGQRTKQFLVPVRALPPSHPLYAASLSRFHLSASRYPSAYGRPFVPRRQRLGLGFLIGGLATLASCVDLFATRSTSRPQSVSATTTLITSAYGISVVAVVLALLFLRESLLDGLMGVAIGGFSVAFLLFLAVPGAMGQNSSTGRRIVVTAAMLTTLSAAASLACSATR